MSLRAVYTADGGGEAPELVAERRRRARPEIETRLHPLEDAQSGGGGRFRLEPEYPEQALLAVPAGGEVFQLQVLALLGEARVLDRDEVQAMGSVVGIRVGEVQVATSSRASFSANSRNVRERKPPRSARQAVRAVLAAASKSAKTVYFPAFRVMLATVEAHLPNQVNWLTVMAILSKGMKFPSLSITTRPFMPDPYWMGQVTPSGNGSTTIFSPVRTFVYSS
jgi:hypothetical protein